MRASTLNISLGNPATLQWPGGTITVAASAEFDMTWNSFPLATVEANTVTTITVGAGVLEFDALTPTTIQWGRIQ